MRYLCIVANASLYHKLTNLTACEDWDIIHFGEHLWTFCHLFILFHSEFTVFKCTNRTINRIHLQGFIYIWEISQWTELLVHYYVHFSKMPRELKEKPILRIEENIRLVEILWKRIHLKYFSGGVCCRHSWMQVRSSSCLTSGRQTGWQIAHPVLQDGTTT